MHPLTALEGHVFEIQYSPNCPSRYLIRVLRRGFPRLDGLHYFKTKDKCCFGETLEAAVAKAVAFFEEEKKRKVTPEFLRLWTDPRSGNELFEPQPTWHERVAEQFGPSLTHTETHPT